MEKEERWKRTEHLCRKCGESYLVDQTATLTADPPRYRLRCSECGDYSYVDCTNLVLKKEKTKPKRRIYLIQGIIFLAVLVILLVMFSFIGGLYAFLMMVTDLLSKT